jgi:anti-anti-sigma factor
MAARGETESRMATDLFQVKSDGPVQVVELSLPSQLDSEDFDRLNDALLTLFDEKPEGRWVLDLSALAYAGSSALGLMVNIRQKVKQAGGRLALCGLSPRLMGVFKTCCLERLFVIKSLRSDAVRAIAR